MPTDRLTITLDSEVLARVDARGTNRSRIISEDLARLYRLADLYHQMPAAIRLLLDGMGLAPTRVTSLVLDDAPRNTRRASV